MGSVNPDRRATVVARGAGRITEVRFREGDVVEKGAELATLESAELASAWAWIFGSL